MPGLTLFHFHARFNSRIDDAPRRRTAISLCLIFSPKKSMPESMESKITPMLSVGKKIALSSLPASVVFSRLQQPKKRPTSDAVTSLVHLKAVFCRLWVKEKNAKEAAEAKANAIKRKSDFCSAYADFC